MLEGAARNDHVELGRGRLFVLGLCVAGLHLALVRYFLDLHAVFRSEPLQGDDFDVHIGQVYRVVEALQHWGHSWAYDPALLAGQPEGTIFDADNKGWELWTFALLKLGVDKSVAFNTFVLAGQLFGPIVVYAAARLFRISAFASVLAAALASCVWFFDSFAHWVWWIGMSSYAAASFFWLVPLALFYRFLESRRVVWAAACGVTLGLAHLLHPYSFFMLALPMGALYLRAFSTLTRREQLAILCIPLLTLAINGYWLLAAIGHWHYVLSSAYFGQTGLRFLIADFFSVLLNPTDTGVIGTRTGFRLLVVGLACVGLLAWRRERDPRLLPLACGLLGLLALAYLGAYLPFAAQIQPYRHVLPAAFVATLPAGAAIELAIARGVWAHAGPAARGLLAVASLLALQHLGSDMLYFMPSLLPEVPVLIDGMPSPLNAYGFLSHFEAGPQHFLFGLPRDPGVEHQYDALVDWTRAHVRPGERVLVDSAVLGERIAWKTEVEVMGGFRERNIAHARANFFRRFPHADVSEQTLAAYLAIFAIEYVITHRERSDLTRADSVLESLGVIEGWHVYKTRVPNGRFLRGAGSVRASLNRLELSGTNPRLELLLSYHFDEALRCEPACTLVREQVPLDDVGFILVPPPHPADFVIRNGYR